MARRFEAMMETAEFRAPWARSLLAISVLGSLLLLGVPLLTLVGGDFRAPGWLGLMLFVVPYGILMGAALFTVRGYRLQGEWLLIRRLLWSTAVSLRGLRSARWDPVALRRSWRICGNGGLFSFSGWFRNRELGSYRMWVTDANRAVVIHLNTRTLVVSPEAPQRFVELLGYAGAADLDSPGRRMR